MSPSARGQCVKDNKKASPFKEETVERSETDEGADGMMFCRLPPHPSRLRRATFPRGEGLAGGPGVPPLRRRVQEAAPYMVRFLWRLTTRQAQAPRADTQVRPYGGAPGRRTLHKKNLP